MAIRYRSVLKWVLYSAGFLLVMLLSTVILGDRRFWGTKLSLVPVYVSYSGIEEHNIEEGGVYVQRVYMGAAMPPDAPVLLTLQILLSLAAGPLFWWLTRLIGKAGD